MMMSMMMMIVVMITIVMMEFIQIHALNDGLIAFDLTLTKTAYSTEKSIII
jgi:hypothetical protein